MSVFRGVRKERFHCTFIFSRHKILYTKFPLPKAKKKNVIYDYENYARFKCRILHVPNLIAELRAPEARARSPIAERIWETHESEKFWFGYDVTSLHPTVRPSVSNPTMLMRPYLFGGKLRGEMRLQQKC